MLKNVPAERDRAEGEEMSDGADIKANCNSCGPSRNHEVIKKVETRWDDDDSGYVGGDTYQLIRCRGCEKIHVRHDSWNNHDTDEQGRPNIEVVYYPPAVSRREPSWISDGPFLFDWDNPIIALLREIYSALHNDSRRLAAMGIRALLEHIMIEKVGDSGSIGENVKRFLAAGHVAKASEDTFKNHLLEFGHAAIHRNYRPSQRALLDITEALIAALYVHPFQTKDLKIPGRPQRKDKP
jgi:Domain of unknown function (DUF4145)